MPPYPPRAFLVSQSTSNHSSAKKKKNARKNVEITPNPLLKFLSTPMSAVYQHFSNEGSKFRSKVAVKDSQDRDSIIPLHFCLLFANYL